MEAGRIDKNENFGKIEIQENGVRAEGTAQTGKSSTSMNEKEQEIKYSTSEPPIYSITGQVMDVGKRCTLGTGEKGQDTSKILGQNRETL